MAKCSSCGKATTFGNNRSHALNATPRSWKPNLKKIKVYENKTPKRVYVCTACIRSNKVNRSPV